MPMFRTQPPFRKTQLAVMISFICQFWHYPHAVNNSHTAPPESKQ